MSQVRLATRSDNIKLSMPFPSRSQFLRRSVCPSTKSAEFLDRRMARPFSAPSYAGSLHPERVLLRE